MHLCPQKWWLVYAWWGYSPLHWHDWPDNPRSSLDKEGVQQGSSSWMADWSIWTLCSSSLPSRGWGTKFIILNTVNTFCFLETWFCSLVCYTNLINFSGSIVLCCKLYTWSLLMMNVFISFCFPRIDTWFILLNWLCSSALILCILLELITKTEQSARRINLLK